MVRERMCYDCIQSSIDGTIAYSSDCTATDERRRIWSDRAQERSSFEYDQANDVKLFDRKHRIKLAKAVRMSVSVARCCPKLTHKKLKELAVRPLP